MVTGEGEGGDKSSNNYMPAVTGHGHATTTHHPSFMAHDADVMQKSNGTRRRGSSTAGAGPIRRGSMNHSNKQIHTHSSDPVATESTATSSYLNETDNISSAMEFLGVSMAT